VPSNRSTVMGVSGLVVVHQTRLTFRLKCKFHSGHLWATLSKLLTYYVLKPTQPPTLNTTGNGYWVKAYCNCMELWYFCWLYHGNNCSLLQTVPLALVNYLPHPRLVLSPVTLLGTRRPLDKISRRPSPFLSLSFPLRGFRLKFSCWCMNFSAYWT